MDAQAYAPAPRATLTNRLRDCVAQAVLAPSSHNTQPWKFRLLSDGVELIADRSRSLPVVDPTDRALTISCGAALYHLRLAMNCRGFSTRVRVLPDADDPDLIARVTVSGPHMASDDELERLDAIPKRRTNRFPFPDEKVDESVKAEWLDDAASEKCWVELIEDDDEKHGIADLIDQGDHLQASDKAFRKELAHWVHSNTSSRRDGMPGHSHGFGNLSSHFGGFVIRTFDWGDGQAAKDRQLAEGSPLIVVIGTNEDSPEAWVACGQALAKMLLRGTARGLAASFMNQPIEVESLRPQLSQQIRTHGFPQILMRWGRGQEVEPTPRRSVDEVLVN